MRWGRNIREIHAGTGAPIDQSVSAGVVQIGEDVLGCLVVKQCRIRVVLTKLDDGEGDVDAADHQSVDEFSRGHAIGEACLFLDVVLFFRSLRPGSKLKLALVFGITSHGKG